MSLRYLPPDPCDGSPVWRGILTGLVPLACLVVLGALTVLATILVRMQTTGEAFLSQQALLVNLFGIGLLVAIVVWTVAWIWVLRRARAVEKQASIAPADGGQACLMRQALSTRWTLAASAFIVLLPVIVAIVFPQHPAQPAP